MKDTPPAIERMFRDKLMQRTGAERLKMGCSMHSTAQALAKAYIAGQHSDAHPGELKQRLFLHFYGADFTPQERTRILSALSVRRQAGGAPAPVRPTTGKPLERADLATGKSTEPAAVRESGESYGNKRRDRTKHRRT
jgi:hypothetical protein